MKGHQVLDSFHDLWQVEAPFRMTKSDLRCAAGVSPGRGCHRCSFDRGVRCVGNWPAFAGTRWDEFEADYY